MQQRLPSLIDPPISFAHRGARAHLPENTLEAFALALKLGARGLETDAWLTADGVVVLDHDGVIGRRPRRRAIGTVAHAELPARIPTLEQLLSTCDDEVHLSIDLKDDRVGAAIIEIMAAQSPERAARVYLCHPDLEHLVTLRHHMGALRLIHSTRLDRLATTAERHAARLAELGIHGINMHHSDWNGGLVTLFHRFGLWAFAWDLQFEHVLRPALRMGLDAVYCDDPEVMADAFRAEIGQL